MYIKIHQFQILSKIRIITVNRYIRDISTIILNLQIQKP